MTERTTKDDDSGSDAGCMFIVGLVIVGICVGNIYSAVWGWLVIGAGMMAIALFAMLTPRTTIPRVTVREKSPTP